MGDVGDLVPLARARGPSGDRGVAALAARQHGVVAHHQLLQVGLGRRAIQFRLAAGRLHRLHVGVYAVGHAAVTKRGRWMAAVLACGPEALLSHHAAAALWALRRSERVRTDVTAPGRTRRGMQGVALHRVRHLDSEDRALMAGIPVTSVARTLLDLAEVLRRQDLERTFEEAERLRLLDLRALEELVRRSHGRHGLRPLRALLADLAPAPATRSELERRFLEVCRARGLPPPAVNSLLEGYEVDMAWPDRRLVVELDGHAFHHTRAAFERDRRRDAALQLAGHRVVRVTYRMLEDDPAGVAELVKRLVA